MSVSYMLFALQFLRERKDKKKKQKIKRTNMIYAVNLLSLGWLSEFIIYMQSATHNYKNVQPVASL